MIAQMDLPATHAAAMNASCICTVPGAVAAVASWGSCMGVG